MFRNTNLLWQRRSRQTQISSVELFTAVSVTQFFCGLYAGAGPPADLCRPNRSLRYDDILPPWWVRAKPSVVARHLRERVNYLKIECSKDDDDRTLS